MTGLVRNAAGRVVHRSDCPHAKGQYMKPWVWAEGKSPEFLADACEGFGYLACGWCQPFREKPGRVVGRVRMDLDLDREEEL